jgi:penicillin-binding protein 1C
MVADPQPLAPHLARRLLKPESPPLKKGAGGISFDGAFGQIPLNPPFSKGEDPGERSDKAGREHAFSARTITSTVDIAAQRVATQVVQQHLLALDGQRVHDGAVLVVENATGDVLAYVGGSGTMSSGRYVDDFSARRQAGSTHKTFI